MNWKKIRTVILYLLPFFWMFFMLPFRRFLLTRKAALLDQFQYEIAAWIVTVALIFFLEVLFAKNQKYLQDANKREAMAETARMIQTDIVPPHSVFKERGLELCAFAKPAKEVGGDFYDYFFVDDKHFAIVIADVSDKDVPAALFMTKTKMLIRGRMAAKGGTPAQILADVNRNLCENNEAGMFVTVWMGILDMTTGQVAEVNAGHERPVIKHGNGQYELRESSHSFVLGMMDDIPIYEDSFILDEGDQLFVYTDGVTEARNNAGKLLTEGGMLKVLNRHITDSPEELVSNMDLELEEYVQNAQQSDDITMLALRRSRQSSKATVES